MGNLKLSEHLDEIQANIEKEIGLEPGTLFHGFNENDRSWQEAKISELTLAYFLKVNHTKKPFKGEVFRNLLHTVLILKSIGQ